jgi:hypothetical protein
MTMVAGVFDNFSGLPLPSPGVEVLDCRKLGRIDVLDPFALSSVVPCGRRPSSFHTDSDASCPLHDCLGVLGPC